MTLTGGAGIALTQLRAILVKNWRLTLRNRRDVFRELGVPILLLSILAFLHTIKSTDSRAAVRVYPSRPTLSLGDALLTTGRPLLWVAPCTTASVARVVDLLALSAPHANVSCFDTEASLLASYAAPGAPTPLLFGAVIIDSLLATPPITYRLRLDQAALVPGVTGRNATRGYDADGKALPPDTNAGSWADKFMPLQLAVDAAITEVLAPGAAPPLPLLLTQQFPSPAFDVDFMAAAIAAITPIYITLVFTLQVRVLLTRILEEKERRIKVALKIMGLSDAMHWTSWGVTAGLKNGLVVTAIALVTSVSSIFPRSSFAVLWLFFMSFCLTCVSFCFMCTALFSKSRTGGAVGMVIYLLLSLPAYALTVDVVAPSIKLLLSIFAPCAFSLGASVIALAEQNKVGVTFQNWGDARATTVGVSLAALTAMLAFDATFMLVCAFYLDRVVPTEYGTTSHPLFCLGFRWKTSVMPTLPQKRQILVVRNDDEEPLLLHTDAVAAVEVAQMPPRMRLEADVEPLSAKFESRPGIFATRLSKVFKSSDGPRLALNELTLALREGSVTCVLGHNGAGKSTFISILTGLISPSAGDVLVYGHSVVNDIAAVRSLIGVCPQHDVLFAELTVREHLNLFGGVKGKSGVELAERATTLIQDLGLVEKADALAGTLSGGQKRRLSVAIALVGDPRVLLLDEPTSGLDPAARRCVWAAIERHKAGRVTLLTTHFMDEAEVLGDSIALLARGALRICGTPLFVKSRLGLGYTLSVCLRREQGEGVSVSDTQLQERGSLVGSLPSSIERMTTLVTRSVPSAKFRAAAAMWTSTAEGSAAMTPIPIPAYEVSYTLPREDIAAFPALFSALEDVTDACAILSLVVSVTSLEDCFVNLQAAVEAEVAAEREADVGSQVDSHAAAAADDGSAWWWLDVRRRTLVHGPPGARSLYVAELRKRLAGKLGTPIKGIEPLSAARYGSLAFFWRQTLTQLWRRSLQLRRDLKLIGLQCVVPVAFTGISLAFRLLSTVGSAPPPPIDTPLDPSGFLYAWGGGFLLPWAQLPGVGADADWLSRFLSAAMPHFPSPPATPAAPLLSNASFNPSSSAAASELLVSASYAAGALLFAPALSASHYSLTILYNTTLTNGLPTLLSMWSSATLAAALRLPTPSSGAPLLLHAAFDPLPVGTDAGPTIGTFLSGYLAGLYVALGYAVIPAVQASSVVLERETRSKQLQLILGATPLAYWVATWLFDVTLFVLPWATTLGILVSLGPPALRLPSNAAAAAALLGLYGCACPWLTYAISFAFDKHADAQLWVRLGFTLCTVVIFMTTLMLDFPALIGGDSPAAAASEALQYIASLLLPPYALAKGLADIATAAVCSPVAPPSCVPPSAWSFSIAGGKLIILAAAIPIWATVVLVIEYRGIPSLSASAPLQLSEPVEGVEDSDVVAERARVREMMAARSGLKGRVNDAGGGITAFGLRKAFPLRRAAAAAAAAGAAEEGSPLPTHKVAVADLSLRVEEGEVFALLGPNGAGKTTALSLLVAEMKPTSGAALVCGADTARSRREALDVMGFCPQADALFDSLTGAETLTYYAALSGTPPDLLPSLVDAALACLDLACHAHALTRTYSGGNKRRLSLAIAYISSPRVVFLDEASTGVDPVARRRMFAGMSRGRAGRTTLMTTHVIEEADALAERVGILVAGRLACLASPQRLKARYGSGYSIDVSFSGAGEAAAVILASTLGLAAAPGVRVVEASPTHARLEAPVLRLGLAFAVLEAERGVGGIVDFTVELSSLEAVFLRFTRMQEAAQLTV